MDQGALVPDSVVIGLVKERIQKKDCAKGYMLDGFPRNVSQAEALDKMLGELGQKIDHVVSVEVPSDELVGRLTGRRTCRRLRGRFPRDVRSSQEGRRLRQVRRRALSAG